MIWHVFANYSSPRYLKLTYFFDPICLHSLILRFKKKRNESKKNSSNQGSDCMSHQLNHTVKIKSVDKFLFVLKKQKTKVRQNATVKKRDKEWACFPTVCLDFDVLWSAAYVRNSNAFDYWAFCQSESPG